MTDDRFPGFGFKPNGIFVAAGVLMVIHQFLSICRDLKKTRSFDRDECTRHYR